MRLVALVVAGTLSALTAAATSGEPPPGSPLHEVDLFDASPGSATQAVDLLSRYAAATRAVPGCLRADLIRQLAPMDNHFALVTVWRGQVERDRQVSSAAARSFRAAFQDIAASPVDERLYGEITP